MLKNILNKLNKFVVESKQKYQESEVPTFNRNDEVQIIGGWYVGEFGIVVSKQEFCSYASGEPRPKLTQYYVKLHPSETCDGSIEVKCQLHELKLLKAFKPLTAFQLGSNSTSSQNPFPKDIPEYQEWENGRAMIRSRNY